MGTLAPMEPLEISLDHGRVRVERVRTGWALDLEGTADARTTHQGIEAGLDVIAKAGGGIARLWARAEDPLVTDAGLALGFAPERSLLQLRAELPIDRPFELTTRAFVPGRDERAWLEVNNRAFDWHPEQGGMTLDDVLRREAEPWFDPAGFLLHEEDGVLLAFCWTKRHLDEEPPLGEIYAIAVDPEAHGRGLGTPMVLAGLDHLHRVDGLRWGMLYVDGSNEGARAVYAKLGFTTTRVDRSYTLEVAG